MQHRLDLMRHAPGAPLVWASMGEAGASAPAAASAVRLGGGARLVNR